LDVSSKFLVKRKCGLLLWGRCRESKSALIDIEKHTNFSAPHPSPLGAWRGWFGSKHLRKQFISD
jgi:uracil-DNA glycosylase